MPLSAPSARCSEPEDDWDDFATGDFESGSDPDA